VRVDEFDYELPPELIAQRPRDRRDAARLLVHAVAANRTEHRSIGDLPELLAPGDLVVVNDARVLPARLHARRASGGRVELLFLEPAPASAGPPGAWSVLANPARKLHPGERLMTEDGALIVHLVERPQDADGRPAPEWLALLTDATGASGDTAELLEGHGEMPLPPYIDRDATDDATSALDRERYQTVYAAAAGAVAAPTAGLHFTPELLARLDERGVERASVTLLVGAGTFRPVKVERAEEHRMHSERYVLREETVLAIARTRARGGRVVAVGTTTVRVLESCVDDAGELRAGHGATELFLLPGAEFRVVDALLTNFHLPKSTLLMLVSAFAGRERILALYAEAVAARYRFFSYGDAMLLLR
jgi:S-adenosylmethionine:tRNA ribosyltransferase-isomerase